jgi:hypothetical protein
MQSVRVAGCQGDRVNIAHSRPGNDSRGFGRTMDI